MSSAKKKPFNSSNKKKSPKTKKQKNSNLSSQVLSSVKRNHNFSEKFQINCSQSQDKKENYNANNENEEEFSIIQSLWDDLGVNIDYQEEFKSYINDLKLENQKNEIINYEKNHLRKLREALLKLSNEVSNRDNNILKLKKYCNELDKYSLDGSIEELPPNIFENIQKVIKFYRINTVNVINKIMRLREISSYYELTKKWDPSLANKSYFYNKLYLLTMFNDIKFVNNSILFNFIETDNGIKKTDLFFSNCINIITNDGTKLKLSISSELQNAINKSKYIILQDTLLHNVKVGKNLIRQRNIFSPKSFRVPSFKPKKNQSEISLVNDKSEKKYYEMFGHNKINLSRTLYYLKRTMGNDYEKMFLNSNNKNSDKKNLDVMNKYFSFSQKNKENSKVSNNNDVNIQYSEGKNKTNKKENKIKEQINKNSEDINENRIEKDYNINNEKKEDKINIESNLENSTNKENNNNIKIEDNTKKEDPININNKEEEIFSSYKKDNKEENDMEINNSEKNNLIEKDIENKNIEKNNESEIKQISNKNSKILSDENTDTKNINDFNKNDIDDTNNKNFTNSGNNLDINNQENIQKENEDKKENLDNNNNDNKEQENEDNNNLIKINNINDEIGSDKKSKKTNESRADKDRLSEKEKGEDNNEDKKEIKEEKNKNLRYNESVEDEEKKSENEKMEEKTNENIIKINNVEDTNKKEEQGELQEKSLEKENDNIFENKENKDENLNNSKEKEKEKNNSKVKLLQYRQYTEEEMKKLNKNDSEDEFISVDYEKI